MAFGKGQSGNPGGKSKDAKLFKDALTLAIKRTEGDKSMLARIAEALVAKAIEGDVPAINAIADRLDGKPTQTIAGDAENPLFPVDALKEALGTKLDRISLAIAAPEPQSRLN